MATDPSLEAKTAHALRARHALSEARLAARREGRPADWYMARPSTQRWAGLSNEGATCYLNSLLQALFVSPEVRRAVFAFCYDEAVHGAPAACVPLQLCKLFTRLQLTQQVALSTRPLTVSFGWSQADSFRQHDVQELCRVLFEALERSGPASVPGSAVPVVELFEGRLRSTLRCRRCGHESARSEASGTCSWASPARARWRTRSRTSCGGRYSRVTTPGGASGASGVSVRARAAATPHAPAAIPCTQPAALCMAGALKGVCFESLPLLLMLQLKRFTYDTAEQRHAKIHHRVQLPHTLRMRRYRSPLPEGAAAPRGGSAEGGRQDNGDGGGGDDGGGDGVGDGGEGEGGGGNGDGGMGDGGDGLGGGGDGDGESPESRVL